MYDESLENCLMRDDIIYGISVKTTNSTKHERIMLCLLLAELEKEKYLEEGETEKISKSKMTNICLLYTSF